MKKSSRGFILPILIIVIVLVVGGTYIYTHNKVASTSPIDTTSHASTTNLVNKVDQRQKCRIGTYGTLLADTPYGKEFKTFYASFINLLKEDNKTEIAKLVTFPLNTNINNSSKVYEVKSSKEFLNNYEKIFKLL